MLGEKAETASRRASRHNAHRHKPDGTRRRQDRELRGTVAECFKASHHTYGTRRLRMDLRGLGHRVGRRRIARSMIFDYIETFYNPRRRHSSLGLLSPI